MAGLAVRDEYPGSDFERLRGRSWVRDRALSGDTLLEQRASRSMISLNSGQSRAIGSVQCDAAQILGITRQRERLVQACGGTLMVAESERHRSEVA